MKNTGMTRPLDDLGRVVIPKEIRKSLSIEDGDRMGFFVENGRLVLELEREHCTMCGQRKNLIANCNGYPICGICMEKLELSIKKSDDVAK